MANPFKGQAIPKAIVVRAIEMNQSMRAAAASIHVSYPTFKKYATMYDVWAPVKDESQISKFPKEYRHAAWSGKKPLGMPKHNNIARKLITEGIKEQKCDQCGFSQYRISDMLVPLLTIFDNMDENDHRAENIKFYCYNCYFILYDIKFKPKTQALWSGKSDNFTNRFTKSLDEKVEEVVDKDADNLGKNLSAIFTKK